MAYHYEFSEIKSIIKEHGKLYVENVDDLNEIDKVLERKKLSKLTKEEMKILTRLIASKGLKLVLKMPPTKKNSGSDDFTGKFYQNVK